MEDYARWLFRLMVPILKSNTPEQTAQYVSEHLSSIKEAVKTTVSADKQSDLIKLLDLSIKAVKEEAVDFKEPEFHSNLYEDEIERYMESLLSKDSKKTLYLIEEFQKREIPINDIYVEILAESMRRIGEMWHTAKINVDTEHYCTSITQMAMAQLYPLLFSKERNGKTLLCACPGTVLHEMGARMVADIFENDGWDSIYLGAAVPEDALMESIRTSEPDLIALSVTMPQHLLDCKEMVDQIRKEFPQVKIAVGGKAFDSTDSIWEKWPIDLYAQDVRELLTKANA